MKSPGTGAEGGRNRRQRRGRKEKRKEGKRKEGKRKEGKREENLITEVNLPTLIVKNNRFICSGAYLPGQQSFCRLPWRVLPKRHRLLHRLPRIHSRQTQAAVASESPLPGIRQNTSPHRNDDHHRTFALSERVCHHQGI